MKEENIRVNYETIDIVEQRDLLAPVDPELDLGF